MNRALWDSARMKAPCIALCVLGATSTLLPGPGTRYRCMLHDVWCSQLFWGTLFAY